MPRKNADGNYTLSAGEVAAYTVCPKSWHLRYVKKYGNESFETESVSRGEQLHQVWSLRFEESSLLIRWIRYLAVMACFSVAMFIVAQPTYRPVWRLFDIPNVGLGVQLILIVIAMLLIIWIFSRDVQKGRDETGLVGGETTISIDGGEVIPVREYVSVRQNIAGRPDALIRENGLIIPIERKPLARKIRDRYIAQVLVYARLVEEFEGKRPPYGYLLLGPSCRRVKVPNSSVKQAWLQERLDSMFSILRQESVASADAHPGKCAKCAVLRHCEEGRGIVAAPKRQK